MFGLWKQYRSTAGHDIIYRPIWVKFWTIKSFKMSFGIKLDNETIHETRLKQSLNCKNIHETILGQTLDHENIHETILGPIFELWKNFLEPFWSQHLNCEKIHETILGQTLACDIIHVTNLGQIFDHENNLYNFLLTFMYTKPPPKTNLL